MKKELFYTIILIIPILFLLSFPAWPVPMTINYQGKLTDPNGTALNGEYQMSFSLFNTDINGTRLWSEQQTIMVANGIYNVQLGAVNPLSASIFDNDALFLEVGIESDTLSPRQHLTSVAFAIKAKEAETVGGFPVEDLITEAEFDSKITTQTFTDNQIPDDITVNYAIDTDKVDGKHASEFGDGHSLDAANGDPVDVLYVDSNGNVGIGTTNPGAKLDIKGDLAVDGFADFFGMNWNEKVGWKWNATGWATVVDYSGSGVLVMVQGFNGHYESNTRLRITIDGVVWKEYTGSSGSGSVGANGWDIVDDSYDQNAAIITLMPFKKFLTSLKVEIYNAASNAESGARVNYLTSVN